MNYTQAKLKISMPDGYTREAVREAAIWMLAKLDASREDIAQAEACLQYGSGH
jgi:hypothetical protein